MAEPGDGKTAGTPGRGGLPASYVHRERAVLALKAAFVQGRLDKDEFDLRLGHTFAARTYAELVAVTADLPAGLPAQPPPARPRLGPLVMGGTGVEAASWAFVVGFQHSYADNSLVLLLFLSVTITYVLILIIAGLEFGARRRERSRGQLPPGTTPDPGGHASPRPPSAGPAGQLPSAGPGRQQTGATEPSRIRRLLPVSRTA